jgi:hypothetical protein
MQEEGGKQGRKNRLGPGEGKRKKNVEGRCTWDFPLVNNFASCGLSPSHSFLILLLWSFQKKPTKTVSLKDRDLFLFIMPRPQRLPSQTTQETPEPTNGTGHYDLRHKSSSSSSTKSSKKKPSEKKDKKEKAKAGPLTEEEKTKRKEEAKERRRRVQSGFKSLKRYAKAEREEPRVTKKEASALRKAGEKKVRATRVESRFTQRQRRCKYYNDHADRLAIPFKNAREIMSELIEDVVRNANENRGPGEPDLPDKFKIGVDAVNPFRQAIQFSIQKDASVARMVLAADGAGSHRKPKPGCDNYDEKLKTYQRLMKERSELVRRQPAAPLLGKQSLANRHVDASWAVQQLNLTPALSSDWPASVAELERTHMEVLQGHSDAKDKRRTDAKKRKKAAASSSKKGTKKSKAPREQLATAAKESSSTKGKRTYVTKRPGRTEEVELPAEEEDEKTPDKAESKGEETDAEEKKTNGVATKKNKSKKASPGKKRKQAGAESEAEASDAESAEPRKKKPTKATSRKRKPEASEEAEEVEVN